MYICCGSRCVRLASVVSYLVLALELSTPTRAYVHTYVLEDKPAEIGSFHSHVLMAFVAKPTSASMCHHRHLKVL